MAFGGFSFANDLVLLAQFPFLNELRLPVFASHRGVVMKAALPDSLIPNLSTLEAPDQAVPLFANNRPIRELILGTLTAELGSNPDVVIGVLDQLPASADGVEAITMHVTKLTQELLDSLGTRFPNLKSLTILGNSPGVPRPGGLGSHSLEVNVSTVVLGNMLMYNRQLS